MTEHVALAVPCAGCGTLTPYGTTDHPGVGSFGEFLATPLGFCFVRTCWTRACVRAARAKVDGKPYTPPRVNAEVRGSDEDAGHTQREGNLCRTPTIRS